MLWPAAGPGWKLHLDFSSYCFFLCVPTWVEEEHCLSLLCLLHCLLLLLQQHPQALHLSTGTQPMQRRHSRWHLWQVLHWRRPQWLRGSHLREASLEALDSGQGGLDGAQCRRGRGERWLRWLGGRRGQGRGGGKSIRVVAAVRGGGAEVGRGCQVEGDAAALAAVPHLLLLLLPCPGLAQAPCICWLGSGLRHCHLTFF